MYLKSANEKKFIEIIYIYFKTNCKIIILL